MGLGLLAIVAGVSLLPALDACLLSWQPVAVLSLESRPDRDVATFCDCRLQKSEFRVWHVTGVINSGRFQPGSFAYHGETRTAVPRILVQRHIHDRFDRQLARAVPRLTAGDGASSNTHIGPLRSRERQRIALRHIETACEQGARVAACAAVPSAPPPSNGYFVPPTVLTNPLTHGDCA